MDKETRRILSKNILNYKYKHRIAWGDRPCSPFPISWKTAWSITKVDRKASFSLTTQRLMLDFFKHEYKMDKRNYIITKENKEYDN